MKTGYLSRLKIQPRISGGVNMECDIDYNEYDSISLMLKENEAERILTYYAAFGWEVYEKRDDGRYFDIVHIKLKRRHSISNKDRLQLLQVEMETTVNRFAYTRKNKYSRSLISALTMGLVSLAFVIFGILLILKGSLVTLAISSIALGALTPVVFLPMIKNTVKEDRKRFALKFKAMTAEISRIISLAKNLYGEENGEI